ncbi:hypothetical protein SLE2022_186760 [Rubroshorea leprosula]
MQQPCSSGMQAMNSLLYRIPLQDSQNTGYTSTVPISRSKTTTSIPPHRATTTSSRCSLPSPQAPGPTSPMKHRDRLN